jgi:hypothetical protein
MDSSSEPAWYYGQDDKQVGPTTLQQMVAARRAGLITDDTLVWRAGMAAWTRAAGAPELAGGLNGPPPLPVSEPPPLPSSATPPAARPDGTPRPTATKPGGTRIGRGVIKLILFVVAISVFVSIGKIVSEFVSAGKVVSESESESSTEGQRSQVYEAPIESESSIESKPSFKNRLGVDDAKPVYELFKARRMDNGPIPRVSARAWIPGGLSKQDLEANIVHGIHRAYRWSDDRPGAVAVAMFTTRDFSKSPAVAVGDYAPYGDWAKANANVSLDKWRVKLTINRPDYFGQAKPASDSDASEVAAADASVAQIDEEEVRRNSVRAGIEKGKEVLAKKCPTTEALAEAWRHLREVVPVDGESYRAARKLVRKLERCRVKLLKRTRKYAYKVAADRRQQYAERARISFLDAGYNVSVKAYGKYNRNIRFEWSLMSDVAVHRFKKGETSSIWRHLGANYKGEIREAGFHEMKLESAFSVWTLDFSFPKDDAAWVESDFERENLGTKLQL